MLSNKIPLKGISLLVYLFYLYKQYKAMNDHEEKCEFCEKLNLTTKLRIEIMQRVCDDCFHETFKYCSECNEYDLEEHVNN